MLNTLDVVHSVIFLIPISPLPLGSCPACSSRISTRSVSLQQTACSILVLPGLTLLFEHETAFWLLLLRLFHRWSYNVPACLWKNYQLRLGVELVCCWNRRLFFEAQRSLHIWCPSQIVCILLFSVCRSDAAAAACLCVSGVTVQSPPSVRMYKSGQSTVFPES